MDEQQILDVLAAHRRAILAAHGRLEQSVAATWLRAWADIADDLDAFARESLSLGTVSSAVRAVRAEQALRGIAPAVERAARQLGTGIGHDVEALAALGAQHTTEAIAAQLTAMKAAQAITVSRADSRQIQAIVHRAQQQVTVRAYYLSRDSTESMKRELLRGVAEGANPKTQAARMVSRARDAFNGGLTRARTIARTETMDAYRAAARATEQANRDVLAGWEWIADLDDRTCRSCLAQHGTMHPTSEDGPDDHHNGRCTRYPVTRTWRQLGFDQGGDLPLPAQPGDGERWLRSQPEEVQRRVLGDRGAGLWRSGQWPPSEWSQPHDNPEWRRSFHAAPAPQQ